MNYTEKLKSCFAENGGRLFFVDGFKNRAFGTVKAIFEQSSIESSVCVVQNFKTAQQIKSRLYESAEIIASLDDFKKLAGGESSPKQLQTRADGFKKNHPNIIITLETSSGAPVLHAPLGACEGKAGEYASGENASYAISDFLADAEYAMIVVDDVYDAFRFEEADRDTIPTKKPQKDERIDLMGKSYFTDVAHSYKKLKKLVDSAAKAIIISDTIVDKEVISFYAGASLINSNFSYKSAKKDAKSKSMDYNDEVDRIFDSISYSQSDETIQSLCLQIAKGRKQYIPGDIEKLGEYSMGNLGFMTKEEIFLRAISSLSKRNKGLNNESLINLLEDDQTLANTVCDIFFADELKGDIESRVQYAHVAKMSGEDVAVFFEIFEKYGTYCSTGEIGNKCKVYRIYHDDSGFEDLIRRSSESFDREENALCASYSGDDVSYKCVATNNLLKEGTLKTPILIVSQKETSRIVNSLFKISDLMVSSFHMEQTQLDKDSIAVIDYDGFESVASDLNVGSVVFFDTLADLNRLDTLVKKAINLSDNVNTALLVTYDNISGVLIDLWQERWMSDENKPIAIRNNEVYMRGERPLDYVEVVAEMDKIYTSCKNVIDGVSKESPKSIAKEFAKAVSEFTLGRAAFVADMEEDFAYFSSIAPFYVAAFANSVSIGACPRPFFAETKIQSFGKKKKKKDLGYEAVEQPSKVAFDVCTKYLHGTCDVRVADCFVCPLNTTKTLVNRVDAFRSGVEGYLTHSRKIMEKMCDDRIERRLDDTISTRGNVNAELTQCIESIKRYSEQFKGVIRDIPKFNTAPYYLEYSTVFQLKEAIQSVHFTLFKKYYEQITDILVKATNEMKKSFDAVGQGAKSSLHTL